MDSKIPAPLKFEGNLSENFKRFKQRFEIYLLATGASEKEDKVKVAMLLNIIGEEGLEIYNNFKLGKEDKQKYDKVISEFETYMNPRKNIIYERYMFNKRTQAEGESIDVFVNDLRTLVKTCEYKDEADNLVRDRIVLGINDLRVQERLLTIENLTLKNAVDICRADEITKEQLREIRHEKSVNVVSKRRTREIFIKGEIWIRKGKSLTVPDV
ncbi:hypothetical protein RI129_008857 [Pyrocoelia pectoralis]|uniref:Retrotransposon gag domain-containing protein n=1 Tax=Pyrocoelia pectoralis TaxID=417401 RepID=A0AAN7V6B1_9COLE